MVWEITEQRKDDNEARDFKRWKKSCNKREALLRDIDPNFYPYQWPLADLNEAFQATLPPDEWIDADITISRYMQGYRNHNSVGSTYGTLTQWKSEEAHRWASVGFPRAILILEAQAHLLSFLRSTVEKILGSTTGYFVESQISSFDEISKCGSTSLNRRCNYIPGAASCYLNRSFSALPIFDIDSLLNIAKAREGLQGDHVQFLQTDPSYARRYIELGMASILGKLFDYYHKFIITSSVLFIQDIVMFLSWGWIVDEVENLKKLQIPLNESLDSHKSSAKAYDVALGSLEALLLNRICRRSKYLDRLDFCLWLLLFDNLSDCKLEDISPLTPAMIFAVLEEHLAKCHETKNLKELARLDETRKKLRQIWVQVRARHEYTLRHLGFGQEDIDHDLSILSADSDPGHVTSIEKRNSEVHAEIAARHAKKPEKLDVPTRSKIKTRKLLTKHDEQNSVESFNEPTAPPASSAASPSFKVLVEKSSYAIFQSMFPTRNFEERTKTVPRDSLVKAMADAGFVASQSAEGSAV
ncbi:hypothetical protein BOTCAL_0157g00080 [Botryotinia calthae]|uniref:Uncharacterized protein n=1 Tax=Botryotinia calthae TaxID=38488 RepID=A0A4Y8D454_9HELO|nr:hypothetical protein BOTCAL_0157g00080 [Botryotinia calthae]